MKRLGVILGLLIAFASAAWAATTCAITGTLTNPDGSNCANCTVQFNSLVTQVVNGVSIAPLIATTTTNASGALTAITINQGLTVQITISESGQTFAPFSAIIPNQSTATFSNLAQGVTTNPLNVLASNQPPTGPLSMNTQKITTLLCPTVANDALAWGCNASVGNLTVTGNFTNVNSGNAFFGLLTDTQIVTPSAPSSVTAIGTSGATTYYYFTVCHDGNSGTTLGSAGTQITNANATLSSSNYDQVAFALPAHALNCDILRNTVNTVSTAQSTTNGLAVTTSPFNDQSNTTAAYTYPARNTTGDGQFAGNLTALGQVVSTTPISIASGGTNAGVAGTGFNNLGIGLLTTLGDTLYTNSTPALTRLPGAANQLATPTFGNSNITNIGTAGATSYTYFVVCNDAAGGKTLASAAGTTTTGNATLNATNYNQITLPSELGCVSWDVLKADTAHSLALAQTTATVNDQGAATSAYTAPVANTTAQQRFSTSLALFGRTFNDGVENSTTTLTSATAAFVSSDVGRAVTGSGIPANTTIASVTNGTTVILSNTESATQSGVTISLGPIAAAPSWGTVPATQIPGFDNVTVTGTPTAGQVVVASSATAATWGSGTRLNVQTGTPLASVTNSGLITTIATFTLPANTLSATSEMRCHAEGNYINNSGATQTYTLTFLFGVIPLVTTTTNITAGPNPTFWQIDARVSLVGVTNNEYAQMIHNYTTAGDGGGASVTLASPLASRATNLNVDTTSNVVVTLRVTMAANTATQTFSIYDWSCQAE